MVAEVAAALPVVVGGLMAVVLSAPFDFDLIREGFLGFTFNAPSYCFWLGALTIRFFGFFSSFFFSIVEIYRRKLNRKKRSK